MRGMKWRGLGEKTIQLRKNGRFFRRFMKRYISLRRTMLSRTVLALKSAIPLAAKGTAFEGVSRCTTVLRDYRTRSHFAPAEVGAAPVSLPEQKESPAPESIRACLRCD